MKLNKSVTIEITYIFLSANIYQITSLESFLETFNVVLQVE